NPEAVAGMTESSFVVKDTKVAWRSYETIVEGRPVIRKEAVMPNILPHDKQGNSSDYIWIRMDADSQQILDQLTPAAEEILRDLAHGKAEAVSSRCQGRRGRNRPPPLHALWLMALWGGEST